ncbi:MAG: hypothetical protein J6P97_05655 [Bacteroidales bacterium]|nr:hypothetical protein [Bacteroidales bacterium]
MAGLRAIKRRIENANTLGRQNLTDKDVEISADATTYEIMRGIADISDVGYTEGGSGMMPPVYSGTEEIENLIDNSGVLDSAEGNVTEKVEQLIEKANDIKAFECVPTARALFKSIKSFPNKATVNLLYATDLFQAFSYWNTEPIPIVEELTVNAPNINVSNNQYCMGQMFTYNNGVKKVILNMPDECQYMIATFNQAKKIEEIVLNFSTKNIISWESAFANSTVKRIVGVLNFSSTTNVNWMWGNALEEVRFEPNTLSISTSLVNSDKLTTDSVQSIINGLATVETAQTLTLHKNIILTDEQKATIQGKGWTLVQ